MFGKKKPQTPAGVLIPLYIYPNPGAWEPLFSAISKHPTLKFTIVVNPNSGPGDSPTPDQNYSRDIPRLNSFSNVRVVGYVSTSWTNRDISLALQDISTYARWVSNDAVLGLGVQGIFFDETPSVYTLTAAIYLDQIATAIKRDPAFGNDPLEKQGDFLTPRPERSIGGLQIFCTGAYREQIIHNPGTIPDQRYLASCNLTVVFEGSYSTYKKSKLLKSISIFQKSSKLGKGDTACIVHGLPKTMGVKDENSFAKELKNVAGSVFVTGLDVGYYAAFWDGWERFVDGL